MRSERDPILKGVYPRSCILSCGNASQRYDPIGISFLCVPCVSWLDFQPTACDREKSCEFTPTRNMELETRNYLDTSQPYVPYSSVPVPAIVKPSDENEPVFVPNDQPG